VNVTLSLVRLGDEQIGDMSSDMVFVTRGVSAKDLLEPKVGSVSIRSESRWR
jgi:hypothetical protein